VTLSFFEHVHDDNIVFQAKLAFMDDRQSRLLRDEMEKEQRTARDLAAARQAAIQESSPSHSTTAEIPMPGSGHVLGLPIDDPKYEEILDSEDQSST
jgi:hypothetical protein